jgi:hypothetical protein
MYRDGIDNLLLVKKNLSGGRGLFNLLNELEKPTKNFKISVRDIRLGPPRGEDLLVQKTLNPFMCRGTNFQLRRLRDGY